MDRLRLRDAFLFRHTNCTRFRIARDRERSQTLKGMSSSTLDVCGDQQVSRLTGVPPVR